MQDNETAWVLGHKIRRWKSDDSYGLIEVTSPPRIPGPPPHYHKSEREFFFILKGTLDVMTDGKWKAMTGWRPKGFEKFFRDFGIPSDAEGAREQSVSDEIVKRVVRECEKYGMYVSK